MCEIENGNHSSPGPLTWTLVSLKLPRGRRIPAASRFPRLCALWLGRPVVGCVSGSICVPDGPGIAAIARLQGNNTSFYLFVFFVGVGGVGGASSQVSDADVKSHSKAIPWY